MGESGDTQFELVNKKGAAVIYVMEEHGKPIPTTGATGALSVANGSAKTEVPLQAGGVNLMEAKSDAKLAAGAKVTATITLANQKPMTVNFVAN